MLNIFIDKVNDTDRLVQDVEKQFDMIKLLGTELDKEIISCIEHGEYYDKNSFIDRFGNKLDISELSTGCKAALCVVNCPHFIINLIECGLNARDIIINLCKEGNILLYDNGITIVDYSDGIDVKVDNYNITSIDRLNFYLFSERPFKPNMEQEGIRCLT